MAGFIKLADFQRKNRIEAHADALQILQTGIQDGSIIVMQEESDYDVYLPPALKKKKDDDADPSSNNKDERRHGLILLPDALVARTAYAAVAQKLATKKGILTIVINSEPTGRLLSSSLVRSSVLQARNDYQQQVSHWSLGGHSLGASVAVQLYRDLDTRGSFQKLVLWGLYGALDKRILRDCLSAEILILQGTRDGFRFANDKAREAWLADINLYNLNDRIVVHQIAGGNHGGFASYDRHQKLPRPDGERSISLDLQHEQIVRVTHEFLVRELTDKKNE